MAALLLVAIASPARASDYTVSVTRKGSNLYKVDGKDIFILTRYCYEYVYYESSVLSMSGQTGEIVFTDSNSKCDVKGAFGALTVTPGDFTGTVSREADDWYAIDGSSNYVKTTLCLNLALGEKSLLRINASGTGTLHFLDSHDKCDVKGIYGRMNL